MIVCICNNVNSTTIKTKLNEGASTIQEIREETGATGCCGKCQFKVNALIQNHSPENTSPQLIAQGT